MAKITEIAPEYYVRAAQDVAGRLVEEFTDSVQEETYGDLRIIHELLNEALGRM